MYMQIDTAVSRLFMRSHILTERTSLGCFMFLQENVEGDGPHSAAWNSPIVAGYQAWTCSQLPISNCVARPHHTSVV